jgi:hypothetical protein
MGDSEPDRVNFFKLLVENCKFAVLLVDEEASEDVEEDWDVEKLPGVAGNGCFGGTSSVLRSSREMVDDDDALYPYVWFDCFSSFFCSG